MERAVPQIQKQRKTGVVVHPYNPSNPELEAGGL
jgi:hypothetical protein